MPLPPHPHPKKIQETLSLVAHSYMTDFALFFILEPDVSQLRLDDFGKWAQVELLPSSRVLDSPALPCTGIQIKSYCSYVVLD